MTPEEITALLHAQETTPDSPRAWTREEMRARFFRQVWTYVEYWDKLEPREGTRTQRDRLAGLAHSLFALLDGGTIGIPALALVPIAHAEDKAYHQAHGENWWPSPEGKGERMVATFDIGGSLAGTMFRFNPARPEEQKRYKCADPGCPGSSVPSSEVSHQGVCKT